MEPELASPQLLVGLAGAYLLAGGARHYGRVVVAAGIACGAALAVLGGAELALVGPVVWVAALVLGALGGVVAWFAERVAVRIVGVFAFAAVGSALAPFVSQAPQWIVVAGTATLGIVLFPPLFRTALPLLTAAGGAWMVAWAVGREDDPAVLSIAVAVGLVVPWLRGRRRDE